MFSVPDIFGLLNLNQINFKIVVVRLVRNAQSFFLKQNSLLGLLPVTYDVFSSRSVRFSVTQTVLNQHNFQCCLVLKLYSFGSARHNAGLTLNAIIIVITSIQGPHLPKTSMVNYLCPECGVLHQEQPESNCCFYVNVFSCNYSRTIRKIIKNIDHFNLSI